MQTQSLSTLKLHRSTIFIFYTAVKKLTLFMLTHVDTNTKNKWVASGEINTNILCNKQLKESIDTDPFIFTTKSCKTAKSLSMVTRSFATKPVHHIIISDVSPHRYTAGMIKEPKFFEDCQCLRREGLITELCQLHKILCLLQGYLL